MQPPASEQILFQGSDFADWASLNDTIMGGRSRAGCRVTPDGLVLDGELVETGGGFVSCRSPRLQPPLDLSPYSALQLDVEGEGRTLKIALGCRDGAMGLTELIPGGLRWAHGACQARWLTAALRSQWHHPHSGVALEIR